MDNTCTRWLIILLRSIMMWSHLLCHYWEGDLDRLPTKFFQHLDPRPPVVLQILVKLRLLWRFRSSWTMWKNVSMLLLSVIQPWENYLKPTLRSFSGISAIYITVIFSHIIYPQQSHFKSFKSILKRYIYILNIYIILAELLKWRQAQWWRSFSMMTSSSSSNTQ